MLRIHQLALLLRLDIYILMSANLLHPPMATSTSHPAFPSRPYTSGLGGQRTPYNAATTFNAPQAPSQQQLPPQHSSAFGAAGPSTTQQQREAQRLERERQERAERERREAEERGVLDSLSEEQREEVNEAVSMRGRLIVILYDLMCWLYSSPSSILTVTIILTTMSSKWR